MTAASLELALAVAGLLWAGWFVLLYRFHRILERVDPVLSREAGPPSLFWTAYHGHATLVRLMRRRDLGSGHLAPLQGLARVLRVWAVLLIVATLWVLWLGLVAPGA